MHKKVEDSQDNISRITKMYADGVSVKRIAELFGVGQTTMFRYFDRNGIETRTRDEAYEIKRLTPDQQNSVWDLYYNSSLNREGIAEKLGVSYYSVRAILDGNSLPGKEKFKLDLEKNTVLLTYEQRQLVLGSLLGDAHLSCRNRKYSHRATDICKDQLEFVITHAENQLGYIECAADLLKCNVSKGFQHKSSIGAGNPIYKLSYNNKYELIKIHQISYIDKRKTITNEWLKEIDAPALAYWFMDDGSSVRSKNSNTVSITFATQCFNKIEHDMLRDKLSLFGLDTTIQQAGSGTNMKIYIRQNSTNRFMDIVEPTISVIPCMTYKIKRKII